MILEDVYYGELELLIEEKDTGIVNEEKKELDSIREDVMIWRFLLTSYFILHGKPFGQRKKAEQLSDI